MEVRPLWNTQGDERQAMDGMSLECATPTKYKYKYNIPFKNKDST